MNFMCQQNHQTYYLRRLILPLMMLPIFLLWVTPPEMFGQNSPPGVQVVENRAVPFYKEDQENPVKMDESLKQYLLEQKLYSFEKKDGLADLDLSFQVADIEVAVELLNAIPAIILQVFPDSRVIQARVPKNQIEEISQNKNILWVALITITADLDGISPNETATLIGNFIEVRDAVTQTLIAKYQVPPTNFIQTAQLDGQPGLELLTTNLVLVNGVALPSMAAIVTHRTRSVRSYSVGSPNRCQIIDLDGITGDEAVFTNVVSINGFGQPAQAVVLTARTGATNTYPVNKPNRLDFENLDGLPGLEMRFSNVVSIDGFGQPAQMNIVTHRTGENRTYGLGSPNRIQSFDLDEYPGLEVVATNILVINGIGQLATATVVTHRTRTSKAYPIGKPNLMTVNQLDGEPGMELLFTDLLQINQVGQPAHATVITSRIGHIITYNAGSATNFDLVELNTLPGLEIRFFQNNGTTIVIEHRKTVVPGTTPPPTIPPPSRIDQYLVGDWTGDGKAKIAVRSGNAIYYDLNNDGRFEKIQYYGLGTEQYMVGDFDGDRKASIVIRRGTTLLYDNNYDGTEDRIQNYGTIGDIYLLGDWDGNGTWTPAVRRGFTFYMDNNFDGTHDRLQNYGTGNSEDGYMVADWNGDGSSNLAARRGNQILKDFNFDDRHDTIQTYGSGNSESEYLSGDWDGNRTGNVAVRRGNKILMDVNNDGFHDLIWELK